MTDRRFTYFVIAASALVAVVSASPYATCWNDGSRLATVECLVDQRTWRIDESMFIVPLANGDPYNPVDNRLSRGTQDKLLIDGHWYSDKAPAPSLWLALCYQLLQSLFGLVAREHPSIFCYAMTICFSGLSYVIAVAAIFRMTCHLGLTRPVQLLMTASFGLASMALLYAQSINNHLPFLAVTSLMTVQTVRLAQGDDRLGRWALLGVLASTGYCLDLGAGPPFVIALAGLAITRRQGAVRCGAFLAAALPLFFVHHVLNYRIGGTFTPANAHAPYLQWPDSPFLDNMTGQWHHANFWLFLRYGIELLFGRVGFALNNMPLLLLVPGMAALVRGRRGAEWPYAVALTFGCAGVWLVYAVSSKNFSGHGCSIRWFVPLIAPGYLLLAILLREHPRCRADFTLLSISGAILMAVGWSRTLWIGKMIPGFWLILAGTLVGWAWMRRDMILGKRTANEPNDASNDHAASRVGRFKLPVHPSRLAEAYRSIIG